MIRYALVCDKHHEFETWFANSAAFDKQVKRGLVTCPFCGSAKVEKALMTPRLARRSDTSRQQSHRDEMQDDSRPEAPSPLPAEAERAGVPDPAPIAVMSPHEQELRQKLRELRDHLVKHAENVGSRFPEEARKIHYGEAEHRSIYGVASAEDAEALHEEGITFSAMPVLPDDRN